jgi:sulfate permease, SulP family
MADTTDRTSEAAWARYLPPVRWLAEYQTAWFSRDVVAGVTLAAYAIPVSLAYAALAGLPPQAGVYGYLLGGLGYALFGSSRQLAIGPTSAISLMIAGTVGVMAAATRSATRRSPVSRPARWPCFAWSLGRCG